MVLNNRGNSNLLKMKINLFGDKELLNCVTGEEIE